PLSLQQLHWASAYPDAARRRGRYRCRAIEREQTDTAIVVGNSGGNQSLVRVNPVTGAQTDVPNSKGCPNGMAVEADGNVVFAGSSGCGEGGIFRITPAGVRTQVTSGGNLPTPYGIAVDTTGGLIVVDPSAFGRPGGVVRVDPTT